MSERDNDDLLFDVGEVVGRLLGEAVQPILARLATVEGALADVPSKIAAASEAVEGRALTRSDVEALVKGMIPEPPAPVDLSHIEGEIADLRAKLKSVDSDREALPAMIERAASDAVAALPKPADGEPGRAPTADEIADAVAKHLDDNPPPAGEPGKSVTPEDLAPMVKAAVGEAVAAIRTPEDGRDATDEQVAKAVADYIHAHPPADGKDGKSVTLDDVRPLIVEAVEKAAAAIPVPKDGVSLAGALIDRDGSLVVTLSDGTAKALGPVVGRDGESVKPEAVAEMVRSEVTKAVEHVKALGPKVDPDLVPKLVEKTVAEAVAKIPHPRDGRDIDPAEVEAMVSDAVEKAVSAIPTPKDGESVTVEDVEPLIVDLVERAVAALPKPQDGKPADPAEVAVMVEKAVSDAVAAIPAPKDGEDGKSVGIEDVAPLILDEVRKAVADLPKPKDGVDGLSVTVEDVAPLIAAEVKKAVSAIPVPKDGTSVTLADVEPLVEKAVDAAISAIPTPKDGESVDPAEVERMVAERVQKAVDALPAPRNGLDAVTFLRDESGHLVVTMSDGTTRDLGRIDGADGLGFDDISAEYDGDRRIVIRMANGDRVKECVAALPIIIDRGVYREGKSYERGDAVTFGGSLWICQADTDSKPGTDPTWRLSVKKGRDGTSGPARRS